MNDLLTDEEEFCLETAEATFNHLASMFAKRYPKECEILAMGGVKLSNSVKHSMIETLYATICILVDKLDDDAVWEQFENFKNNLQKALIYEHKTEQLQ